MAKSDKSGFIVSDLLEALMLLTRLPLPQRSENRPMRGGAAAWAYPLVGAVVGLLAGTVAWALVSIGISNGMAATGALIISVVLTGAMHEDGLADTLDGLWGGWEKQRRLDIMKDSTIGTYGVVGLVIALLIRWEGYLIFLDSGSLIAPLMAIGLLSRVPMVLMMAYLPNARGAGLSSATGKVGQKTATTSIIVAVIGSFLIFGFSTLFAILAIAAVATGLALIAMRKIGGQTGDILGASQQISEIAALAVLTSLLL